MENFVCVFDCLYQGYENILSLAQPGLFEHKRLNWRQNTSPPTFLARQGLLVSMNAFNYSIDLYKRGQIKAILSFVNLHLSLRLFKANTKDMGMQVSLQVDKPV